MLHAPIPSALYHYTSINGLAGIIESNAFWASHAEYLNDSGERTYAASLVKGVLEEVAAEDGNEGFAEILNRNPHLGDHLVRGMMPFVVCFCESGDLLSQWRGYGGSDASCSLGLDMSKAVVQTPTTMLRKVIYKRETQEQLVRDVVLSWLGACASDPDTDPVEKNPYPAVWVLQRMLHEFHLCFKHPAFAEEQEWRLIHLVDLSSIEAADTIGWLWSRRDMHAQSGHEITTSPPEPIARNGNLPDVEVLVRPSRFGFIPYIIEPVIDPSGVFSGRLPLTAVVQGPSENGRLAMQSLRLFLLPKGYHRPHTVVEISGVPLRNL